MLGPLGIGAVAYVAFLTGGSAVRNGVLFVGLGIPVGGKKAAQDADESPEAEGN